MGDKSLTISEKTIFDGVIIKQLFKGFFGLFFKLTGWSAIPFTFQSSGVAIAAPHTSNWDFIFALGAAISQDMKIYFSIKESWCTVPVIGRFMLWLGAIPIARGEGGNGQVELIKQFIAQNANKQVLFLFTPEGTRADVNKWRTGFYYLALETSLPIFLAKIDYTNKEAGVFHCYHLSNNKQADIVMMQSSYALIRAKYSCLQFPKYISEPYILSHQEAEQLAYLNKCTQPFNANMLVPQSEQANGDVSISDDISNFINKGLLEPEGDSTGAYRLTVLARGSLLHHYKQLPEPAKGIRV